MAEVKTYAMYFNQRKFIIAFLMITGPLALAAQVNVPKFEIGAGLGGYVYQGDLTPTRLGSFRTTRVGLNLYFSKLLSPSFATRTNLAIAGLRGDDSKYDHPEYRRERAFKFRSPVFELSQLLIWNPLKRNYDERGFYPYLFGGAGISFIKVKRDWSSYNAEYFAITDVSARLGQDTVHSTPRVIPVIPLGIGLRYGISSRLAVSVESSYRLMFTDYLDGFSQAANPEKNDHYHSTTIGLIYRIGKKNMLGCPVLKY
jgi:hypothetical protein